MGYLIIAQDFFLIFFIKSFEVTLCDFKSWHDSCWSLLYKLLCINYLRRAGGPTRASC